MTAISWKFGVSGDWNTGLYWSGGVTPGAGDDVTIAAPGTYSVTLSSADAAHSLIVNDVGVTVSVNYGGSLALGGALTVTAGTFQLNGGVVTGGTLSASGGTFEWTVGTLDGVTYDGTLEVAAGSRLFIGADGLIARDAGGGGPGTVDVTGGILAFNATQTFDNATIDLGAGGAIGGATLTLGAGLTVDQTGIGTSIQGATVINDGTINAALNNGQFYIGFSKYSYPTLTSFTNVGDIDVADGDTVRLQPYTAVNEGTISISGGTLVIGDAFVMRTPGTFDNRGTIIVGAGGTLAHSGGGGVFSNGGGVVIANAGATVSLIDAVGAGGEIIANNATLELDGHLLGPSNAISQSDVTIERLVTSANLMPLGAHGNSLTLKYGTISNGGSTLDFGPGTALGTVTFFSEKISGGTIVDEGGGVVFKGGELNGVTWDGALDLAASGARLELDGGGAVFHDFTGTQPGAIDVTADDGSILIDNTQTIDSVVIDLAGDHAKFLEYANPKSRQSYGVTLGPDTLVEMTGAAALIDGAAFRFDGIANLGTIHAGAAGGQNLIAGSEFWNKGTISVGAGDTLTFAPRSNFVNLNNGTLTAGAFEADAGSTFIIAAPTHDAIVTDAAVIVLSGAGSVLETVDASAVDHALETTLTTIAAGGGLELLDGRGWSSANALANIGIIQLGGGTFAPSSLVNSGVVTGYGVLATTVSNSGVLDVEAGQTLGLVGGALANLAGTTLTGGTYSVGAGATLQLANDTAIATLNATLILSGAGSTVQGFDTTTALQVGLKTSLKVIGPAGALELLAGRNFAAVNAITNLGSLQLAGGSFAGPTLKNAAGARLLGYGAVTAAVTDGGTIEASGGVLDFTQGVVGVGSLSIDSGATLELDGAAARSLTATFNGAGAVLALGQVSQVKSTLAGFAAGDAIDLLNTAATRAVLLAGDQLVIRNGKARIATLQLSGDFTGQTFQVSSDGHGSSLITLVSGAHAPPASLLVFSMHASALGASAVGEAAHTETRPIGQMFPHLLTRVAEA